MIIHPTSTCPSPSLPRLFSTPILIPYKLPIYYSSSSSYSSYTISLPYTSSHLPFNLHFHALSPLHIYFHFYAITSPPIYRSYHFTILLIPITLPIPYSSNSSYCSSASFASSSSTPLLGFLPQTFLLPLHPLPYPLPLSTTPDSSHSPPLSFNHQRKPISKEAYTLKLA